MELALCTRDYWDFVRELRTNPAVAGGFVEHAEITQARQEAYMERCAENFRVALVDGAPAGYVRVIDGDISVCTHPSYQGRGVGKFMITEALKLWPDAVAKIKVENQASVALFEACGFKRKFFIYGR